MAATVAEKTGLIGVVAKTELGATKGASESCIAISEHHSGLVRDRTTYVETMGRWCSNSPVGPRSNI